MPLDPAARPAINIRSIALGLAGVVFICAFTPYNDYVLNNTFLIGNNLPLGVTMLAFLFTLCVNGPLSKFAPRVSFSTGEIVVAFSMTLVSCALPSSGLMRALPAAMVAPFNEAGQDDRYWQLLRSMNLPPWLFPKFTNPRPWNDPVVQGFVTRGEPMYAAWIVPILAWGVFTFALYTALLCLMTIVRKQWMENERLAFPLAQIQMSLIDQPPRGRWLNALMQNRSFWMAFFAVFLLHVWNGLARYSPQYFPAIPLSYNIERLVADPPWNFADVKLKDAAIFFTVVGATYFVPSSVALSIWVFFILNNIARMTKGSLTGEPDNFGAVDEHLGGLIAFALTIFWIGRRHWRLVLAQAFRGEREGEERERYLPHRFAFWTLLASIAVMIAFLWLAGMTLGGAIVSVAIVLTCFLIITRIVAETGLVYAQIRVSFVRPWTLIASYAKSGAWLHPVPTKTFFLGTMIESQHYDFREVMPVYASHAMKIADQTIAARPKDDRRTGRRFIGLLALALVVGYFVSFSSMLWVEYRYAFAKDSEARLVNEHGARNLPQGKLVMYPQSYDEASYYIRHEQATHIGIGFGITALLGFMRLRFAWWPLHPIGFLMITTVPGAQLWLSIFAGWLIKTVIVRFGGSRGYVAAKPFFLGLIVGESAAAGFWLIMGIALSALGLPYHVVNIMPG